MGEAAQQCRIKTDWLYSFTQEDNPGCYQTSGSKRGWRAEQLPTGELQCDVVTRVGAFLE